MFAGAVVTGDVTWFGVVMPASVCCVCGGGGRCCSACGGSCQPWRARSIARTLERARDDTGLTEPAVEAVCGCDRRVVGWAVMMCKSLSESWSWGADMQVAVALAICDVRLLLVPIRWGSVVSVVVVSRGEVSVDVGVPLPVVGVEVAAAPVATPLLRAGDKGVLEAAAREGDEASAVTRLRA